MRQVLINDFVFPSLFRSFCDCEMARLWALCVCEMIEYVLFLLSLSLSRVLALRFVSFRSFISNVLWKPDTRRFVSSMMDACSCGRQTMLKLCSSALFTNVIIRCFHVNSAKHLIIKINLRVTLNAFAFNPCAAFFSLSSFLRCNRCGYTVSLSCHVVAVFFRFKYRKLFVSIES